MVKATNVKKKAYTHPLK